MSTSRRDFLASSSIALMGAAIAAQEAQAAQAPGTPIHPTTPGAPTAFGTSAPVGPKVSPQDFASAEKLVQFEMTAAERAQAAGNWREQMAGLYERRVGPRKFAPEPALAPATQWNPSLPGLPAIERPNSFVRSSDGSAPLPASEADIAFASVTQLSRWIESRKITSERLTEIYLERLQRFDKQLHCVITLTREHALKQAR